MWYRLADEPRCKPPIWSEVLLGAITPANPVKDVGVRKSLPEEPQRHDGHRDFQSRSASGLCVHRASVVLLRLLPQVPRPLRLTVDDIRESPLQVAKLPRPERDHLEPSTLRHAHHSQTGDQDDPPPPEASYSHLISVPTGSRRTARAMSQLVMRKPPMLSCFVMVPGMLVPCRP